MRKTSGVPGKRPRSLTRSPASLTRRPWTRRSKPRRADCGSRGGSSRTGSRPSRIRRSSTAAELNRRTMQGLTQLVREQREVFHQLSHESLDAYDGFVDSLSSYYEEVAEDPEDD
jgi:hypothetical protein